MQEIDQKIQIKVSLIVCVIDDFTGEVLTGDDVKVTIKGARPPIRKKDGYFVFLNDLNLHGQIRVESYQYQEFFMEVDLNKLQGDYPLIKIRLKPDSIYHLPKGSTSLSGFGEPNKKLMVIPEGGENFWKLRYPYSCEQEKPDQIAISYLKYQDLEGQTFEIVDQEGVQKEQFIIVKQSEEREYCLLENPLCGNYKKNGTRIFRVYSCQIKKDGSYFLPMQITGSSNVRCRIYYDGEEEQGFYKEIETGNKNQLDVSDAR